MRKLNLICFIFFCLYSMIGQNSKDITIGEIKSINSEILNEERKIWIHVPKNTSGAVFEEKNYPVVYLLDGENHFNSVTGILNQLSTSNTICPKMIVVGITNTNRTRDLTPTKAEPSPMISDHMADNSGGGENFMSFIEKELIPYIDSNYPTDPYRMFIGHSFGGLTVMNTLIEKPELFNSYVSIDPSMWWDNQKLLTKIKKIEFKEKHTNKSLYLAIANNQNKDVDTLAVKKDTTSTTIHIRSLLDLNSHLKNDKQKKISFESKFYKDDNHGSVPLIAEYDALRSIFDFYELSINMHDFMNPEKDILMDVQNHYKKMSKVFGKEVKPDEELINQFGYDFMETQQFKKAEKFFKLNTTNYPNSFNVFDSLGDFYLAIENKEKAIESFKKSIAINKDSYSKKKLEKLQKQ